MTFVLPKTCNLISHRKQLIKKWGMPPDYWREPWIPWQQTSREFLAVPVGVGRVQNPSFGPGTFAKCLVSHRPQGVCSAVFRVCWEPSLVHLHTSVPGSEFCHRCLLWAFAYFKILCPLPWVSCTLEKNLEPCKGRFLWSNTEKVCELYFQAIQEMEIDLLMRPCPSSAKVKVDNQKHINMFILLYLILLIYCFLTLKD